MVIAQQPFCWKLISVTKISKYGQNEYSQAFESYTFQPLMGFWYILKQWIVFFTRSEWLLNQWISNAIHCMIHLQFLRASKAKPTLVSFAAVSRVVTCHATLLPTSGEERCVTSDDPNNGCEGDYAQYWVIAEWSNIVTFCPKNPKWDQSLQFKPQSETSSIPATIKWEFPPSLLLSLNIQSVPGNKTPYTTTGEISAIWLA